MRKPYLLISGALLSVTLFAQEAAKSAEVPPAAAAETQTTPVAEAKAEAPADAAAESPAPATERNLSGTIDVGARWLSGVSGDFRS